MKRALLTGLAALTMAAPQYARADEPKLPAQSYEANGNWTSDYAHAVLDAVEANALEHNPTSTIRRIEIPLAVEMAIDYDNDGVYDVFTSMKRHSKEFDIEFSKAKVAMIPGLAKRIAGEKILKTNILPRDEKSLQYYTDHFNKTYIQSNPKVSLND